MKRLSNFLWNAAEKLKGSSVNLFFTLFTIPPAPCIACNLLSLLERSKFHFVSLISRLVKIFGKIC